MYRCGMRMLAAACVIWVGTAGAQWVPSHATDPGVHPVGEFIYAPATVTPQCHASTVVALKDGDLLAAWFGGKAERAPDVAIYTARKHKGVWSAPVEVAREKNGDQGIPTWNPVLFHTSDGKLWLYYKYGPSPDTWAGKRMVSTDEGKTWSPKENLPDGVLGPIRARPLVLPNGVIVSGSSNEGKDGWRVFIERSADGGKSWKRIGPLTISREDDAAAKPWPDPPSDSQEVREKDKAARPYSGIIQPSVISLGGKHLRFYARSKTLASRIVVSDSTDEGLSWSTPHYLDLPNNNSGLDVVALKDGREVMIFNDTTRGRSPLNLAVSTDGEHFRIFATLEQGEGEYSYPAIIQGNDKALEMTYTWHRTTIKHVRLELAQVPAK
ncbi:Predicted neuraminidase (sialidase) [Terriglobus roseus]|uniref:Predicted neuraminidase (Sialidase) n=1 Tax=Terriglobus roseus TaxID=392734 RepID=A0A1G7I1F0_9BACT|nr:Predicted neuraminidase (sialidase) [Terriglobus roseus]